MKNLIKFSMGLALMACLFSGFLRASHFSIDRWQREQLLAQIAANQVEIDAIKAQIQAAAATPANSVMASIATLKSYEDQATDTDYAAATPATLATDYTIPWTRSTQTSPVTPSTEPMATSRNIRMAVPAPKLLQDLQTPRTTAAKMQHPYPFPQPRLLNHQAWR